MAAGPDTLLRYIRGLVHRPKADECSDAALLRRFIKNRDESAFAALVDRHPKFERVAPAPLSVVCFRYKGSDDENRAIMEKVNASGRVFIASTVLNGQLTLRLAIGNLETTWKDVEEAWELLQEAAHSAQRVVLHQLPIISYLDLTVC